MLKVALVGVGGISGTHIPCWDKMEDVELVALCDVRPERMEKYEGKRKYTDFDEMLEKEEIDILDICVPTYLHVDFAVKAMEKGIHVLSEKPISMKKEDVKRAYDCAEKNNVCFMVAQVLRFWDEYVYLKEIIDTKKYGKLLAGYMGRLGPKPKWSWDGWYFDEKRSGLVPYDLHIHDLDFMVYALGKPQAVRSNQIVRPEQDYMSVTYDYDGFFVNAEASWYAGAYPFQASFRFVFEGAILEMKGNLKIYENDGKVIDVTGGGDGGAVLGLPKTNAYGNEIRYFTDCVKAGVKPDKVKPFELETVIECIDKIKAQ